MKTKKQTTMERYLLLLYASFCLTTLMLPVPEQRSLVPLFLASHTVWNKKLEPGRPPAPFVFEAAAVRWRCAPGMTCLPWLSGVQPSSTSPARSIIYSIWPLHRQPVVEIRVSTDSRLRRNGGVVVVLRHYGLYQPRARLFIVISNLAVTRDTLRGSEIWKVSRNALEVLCQFVYCDACLTSRSQNAVVGRDSHAPVTYVTCAKRR